MIKIYTDGSCLENPGNGGWAAIIIDDEKKTQIKGSKKNTTNNQMELLAPIEALKKIHKGSKVQIFTDSKYVKSGITEWIHNWKKNGWKTADKQPVKNKVKNFINGYKSVRKISIKEKNSLNILCKGAAMRYLLTRIYDYFNTPKNAYIKIKDPKEYFQKLVIHNKLNKFEDYLR